MSEEIANLKVRLKEANERTARLEKSIDAIFNGEKHELLLATAAKLFTDAMRNPDNDVTPIPRWAWRAATYFIREGAKGGHFEVLKDEA